MAFKCIPADKIDEFKRALKSKDISLSDLVNLDHDKLVAKLEPYAGNTANDMATLLEEKLILKNKMQGLKNFISRVTKSGKYSPENIAEAKKHIEEFRAKQQERIFSPKEGESYLGGLVNKIMGQETSREVAAKVFELSNKAEALRTKDQGLFGASDDYLKAKQDLTAYVNSQKPTTLHADILKNLSIIGRNNLLLNPSTPVKTTIGQTLNTFVEGITRRLGNLSASSFNNDLASKANSEAWKTFMKTGQNVASMESMDDVHMLGKGETFALPTGTTNAGKVGNAVATGLRNVAEASNTVAIKWEHNVSFTKFYQKAFFDMVNLHSSGIAKSEGLSKDRASEIFQDACKIEPQTTEGKIVRREAQKQAARVTSTNDTLLSGLTLQAKNALNKWVPNLRVGDLIAPIAKIPATIISNGIDNAGGGIPFAVKDIFKGREAMQSDDLETRLNGMAQFHNGVQRAMRIGGTIGTSMLLASQINKKDFKTDRFGESFVRIGGLWVNLEYINYISPALSGAMQAKMKGKDVESSLLEYVSGATKALKKTPVVSELPNLLEKITESNMVKGVKKYAEDFATSRGVPSFLHNLFKDRPINRLFFGAHGLESQHDVNKDEITKKREAAKRNKK